MNFDIHRLTVTASTNDDARQAAEQGASEGTVIWALSQSSGRGRHGRQWSSPPGNLYCSVVLRPSGDISTFGQYSFVAALALSGTVQSVLANLMVPTITMSDTRKRSESPSPLMGEGRDGGDCDAGNAVSYSRTSPPPNPPPSRGRAFLSCHNTVPSTAICTTELKWPNDVLVNGKKISGILLESGAGYLIVGMGLNILHTPDNPLYPTTSLSAECFAPPPLESVLGDLLRNLEHWYDILRAQGFAPIRAAWLSRARKGLMRVRLPEGEIHGEFADLDENGNLVLLLPDGSMHCIHTGDVFF